MTPSNPNPGTSFQNSYHELRTNLLKTSSWLRLQIKAFLDDYELTQQQFNALRILRGTHPEAISTREITERMVDYHADTSRVIERLAKKGLVQKKASKEDKRRVDITISPDGLHKLEEIDLEFHLLDEILGALNLEKVSQLNNLLYQLRGERS